MVFAISYNILDNARFTNCGEGFLAIPAGVRLDSGVSSLVNEEVTLLGKDLAASYSVAFEQVLAAVGRFLVKNSYCILACCRRIYQHFYGWSRDV
jgi:hypothetical protein